MNIQQGTDQHNRIISFGALECQQPQLLVLEIITFKFGKWWGGKKNPTTSQTKSNLQSYPWASVQSRATCHHSYSCMFLFHTIIGSTVTGSKGRGKIPSWVAPNPKRCAYGKVQQIKTWSHRPHFGIKRFFSPNLLFVVCSSLKGKPGKRTFCRTKKKKKIKLYLIGIEPGEGRSKMQRNNRKYSCFWNDPHTSSLSYNAQMSWKLSATPSGIPHFSWTFII